MAQARYTPNWNARPAPCGERAAPVEHEDWNALRDELENLLDQVHQAQHDEVARTRIPGHSSPPPASYGLREPRHSGYADSSDRRQEALHSVQRALDRFSEQEEASPMPAHSQQQLQQAIRQIRSSQRGTPRRRPGTSQPSRPVFTGSAGQDFHDPDYRGQRYHAFSPAAAPAMAPMPAIDPARLDDITDALSDISARLNLFERNLSEQQASGSAVADMAEQIEQLSAVVEHLAGNIGETGHIRRLESQIAKMADAVASGSDLDFQSLNNRLDVLTAAFEQLQELQNRQLELSVKSHDEGGFLDSIDASVRNIYDRLDTMGLDKLDLQPIEDCVRTVYDRIDALEQTMAMPTPAIERLSREMAEFTAAMRDSEKGKGQADLLRRTEKLVKRIEQIEKEGGAVGELKLDMAELQQKVAGALEPRFSQLEKKLGEVAGQISSRSCKPSPDAASAPELEKHIRELTGKLEQTSADIAQLKQAVSSTGTPGQGAIDMNAIADLVAERTSRALETMRGQPGNALTEDSLGKL
ncbi:MAG TPA: hypothetical protein ENJ68_04960, partial [Devosia sp.]|nr:hypothetical protein [Devosia sp.]